MAINYLFKGIDLSTHNGPVDFKKVKKAGYDFVILRAGYGRLTSQKDARFEDFYKEAKEAGLEIGAYWYSYAYSVEGAIEEAKACLECIKGKKFSFPVYYDVEEPRQFSTLDKATLTKMVNAFCQEISKSNYLTGLYTGYYAIKNNFNASQIKYEKWLAKWSSSMGDCSTEEFGLWQYAVMGSSSQATMSGKVPGCDNCSDVDMDYCFKDYPAISGFSFSDRVINETPKEEVPTTPSNNVTIKTGQSIYLNGVSLYASAGSKKAVGLRTGTFYIYSNEVINGKVRITNSANNVGKTPTGTYVTGWIKLEDVNKKEEKPVTPSKPVDNTNKNTVKAGNKITLTNEKIYASATAKNASATRTGTFYIYSNEVINNRVRITNSANNVGKTPMGTYVTGWINVK